MDGFRFSLCALMATMAWVVALTDAEAASGRDGVDVAYAVCQWVDSSNVSSQDCEVSGWNQTVSIFVDVGRGQGAQICEYMISMLSSEGVAVDSPGWELLIYSPYSGDRTIAQCDLPVAR